MRTAEQKKWLKIAEAFGTPVLQRTLGQDSLTRCGLCNAYRKLTPLALAFHPIYDAMPHFLDECHNIDGTEVRVLVACLFAAMTDKERHEVLPLLATEPATTGRAP